MKKFKEKEIICSICKNIFIVKQIKGNICKYCQKKINDKKYYINHKEKIKQYQKSEKVKQNKKISDKKYYIRNKEKLSLQNKEKYLINREKILKKQLQQRREKGILPNGSSGLDLFIFNILKEKLPNENILFHNRTTIKRNNNFLELDFYFPNKKIAIEVQGITHYKPIYGKEKFKRTIKNDLYKKEQCKILNIKLIEIKLENGIHYERNNGKKIKMIIDNLIINNFK